MEQQTQPKYKVGDKVVLLNDEARQTRTIVNVSYDGENVFYKATSTEVDVAAKKLIEGIVICREAELNLINSDTQGE